MNLAWREQLAELSSPAALGLVMLAAGLAIALLPLEYAVLSVLGSTALVGILLHPTLGVYLLAFAVPFGSLREIALGSVSVGAVEALTGLIIVAWVARMVAARQICIQHLPMALPLLLFIGALAFSLTVTTSLPLSLKEIAKWLEVLAIYLFLAHEGDLKSARVLIACLLVAASGEALLGIYQFLRRVGPEGFVVMGRFMRAYGTFRQPNPYAGYLGLHLPLAIGLLITMWPKGRCHSLLTWISLGSLILMGMALIMSWSRGGWLGFAVAVAIMALFASRRMALLSLALAVAVAFFLLMGGLDLLPPSLIQRVSSALPYVSGIDIRTVEVNDDNWAVVERMAHWDAAWQMFAAHPWRGVGIGNYAVVYPQYALPRWQDPLGHAHNYPLNIAAETGLIGLLAYVLFWAACFVYTLRVLRRVRGLGRGIALAALGIWTHLAVHNTVDNLFVQGMYMQVGFVLGLLHFASRTSANPTEGE